jgi:hypothetical protein
MNLHVSTRRTLKLISLAVLVGLALLRTDGTNVDASGEEWRPIDPAHIALKAPTVEPDADAEAIFWDIRVDDGPAFELILSHYVRIKIFTERGREKQSKVNIPFLNNTKIKDVAARTIKPDGTVVELAKADIIEQTIVKVSGVKLKTKSFALPGIEIGAIIEYQWKEVIPYASANNMRLQFQREIPVRSITYRLKPGSGSLGVRAFNMSPPGFQKETGGFHSTTVTNMPAFREEPMMPPEDNVRAWALIRYQNVFTQLDGYNFLASRVHITAKPHLKADDDIKRKAVELTAGATTSEEKLKRIFDFCRLNIKNTDSRNSGLTDQEIDRLKENKKPSDTLKRGVGSGGDVNLLFGALASAAGFETRVALMPDRGRQLFDRKEVFPDGLLPANIAVQVGDSWRFFDPAFLYVTLGMLRWQQEGVDALIADETPIWVVTPMSPPEKSKERRVATLSLDEHGTLEGDVSIEYTGHRAVERKLLNDDDSPAQREENLKEAVKKRLSSAELTNIVIENVTDPNKPFIYKYHVRVPEYAQRTGKRLFLQPGYFEKGVGALFTASTRKYPIYFHYPWSEEDKVTVSLPKGYVLDNADRPPPINAGEICRHEVNMGVTSDQQTLIYNRKFFFGGQDAILFPVKHYEQLKRLFEEINKADNHLITLKQAGPGD